MRYKLRRYIAWIVALIVCILILTIIEVSGKIAPNVYLGLSATTITIYISIINYYQTSDKFFKELFTDFNRRYDSMNEFLNQISENQVLSSDDRQRVIDYLNLCAEEYMWVQKGRLPEHIWESWKNGIEVHLKKESIKKIFEEERSLWKSSYYGFFDGIKL